MSSRADLGQVDDLGQVMLTCAFLFAIILVIITLMLNNVIYSNNVAYQGFMGQSSNEQRSIKKATQDEAALAYQQSGGDPALFRQYMADFAAGINAMTVTEGTYLTVSPSAAPIPAGGPSTAYQATETLLNIYEKNFNYSYRVTTSYYYDSGSATPTPTPSATPTPVPGYPVIVMGANKTTVVPDGNDFALIFIQASDQLTNLPLQGATVSLHATNGEFQDMSANPVTTVATDSYGRATLRYLSLVEGTQSLNATYGGATSNTVTIDCQPYIPPGTSTHPPSIGSPTASYSSRKSGKLTLDYVTVTVPVTIDPGTYDFDNFKVQVYVQGVSNLRQLSSGDVNGIYVKRDLTGPGGYYNTVSAKLNWIDTTRPYSVTLYIVITADDMANNVAYTHAETVTYSGPPPAKV